jgi:hypothetical protein
MTAAKNLGMITLVAVLLMAAFTIPLGLQVAEAHKEKEKREPHHDAVNFNEKEDKKVKDDVDPRRDVTAPMASAENKKFKAKDFDIKEYGFDGDDLVLTVYGKAGKSIIPEDHPHEHDVYAYALKVAEDASTETYEVVDNHPELAHDPAEAGKTWHAQTVVFHKNAGPDGMGCFDVEGVAVTATMKGHDVIISNSGRTEIMLAVTLLLELIEHPEEDPFETEIVCNAIGVEVWDFAPLGTKTNDEDDDD